ncbi:MAG: hypothetical protein FWD42_04445 [Solirubrobacterales bacterium]|nr:hypothetical protein [Solirubrobacterales bacterium]
MSDSGRAIYAGIGARCVPNSVLLLLEQTAAVLGRQGWVLRTGMSPGADQAFYRGALQARGEVELYLPWPGFEQGARGVGERGAVRVWEQATDGARELAARFHPGWEELDRDTRSKRARDVHQVLGRDLATPVRMVVCWTEDGGIDGASARSGGTGQALRVAHSGAIPVINLARQEHEALVHRWISGEGAEAIP